MFKITNLLVFAFTIGLPLTVQARPGSVASDRAYCARLSETYARYIGHDNATAHRIIPRGSNDAQVASTQCQTNTAWAIPVLEQQLAANKFALPARD
jgi:hypothetical protein